MTNNNSSQNLENYLQKMWVDYCQMNPQAQTIYNLLTSQGEVVSNDHIALRTFNHPKLGIASLAQHFTKYGYQEKGEYFFKEKKLYAKHYENTNPLMPKIFISELEIEKMSAYTQQVIQNIVEQIPTQKIQNEDFVFSGRSWNADHQTYLKLADESEYASWVYAYGFRPNHFTVNINQLKNFQDIQKLNQFLKDKGHKLNTSGGEIKGTPEELLEQSSTMAEHRPLKFSDVEFSIPACYYEFAKRYSMANGQLYQGFIAKSADKIFESTNRK